MSNLAKSGAILYDGKRIILPKVRAT